MDDPDDGPLTEPKDDPSNAPFLIPKDLTQRSQMDTQSNSPTLDKDYNEIQYFRYEIGKMLLYDNIISLNDF